MRILRKEDNTVAPLLKDQRQGRDVRLKRSEADEISLPLSEDLSPTCRKKVRFQSELKDSDYQANEEIEIDNLKKLSHEQCGRDKEFHIAICTGEESKIMLLLNALNQTDKMKIFHGLCTEEEFAGASILRLALRTKQLSLIDTLIKQGANPYHCSADGNTLMHDIILDINYAALKILLRHTPVNEQFIKFINLPFHGNLYGGYFALDIICVEATFHFKSYHQASKVGNRHIAESFFSIIQKLILNHAISKLLTDEHDELSNYLRVNRKNKFYQKSLWNLIARIAELHELKTMPTLNNQTNPKIFSSNINSHTHLVAQRWQSNGLLSETKHETPVHDNLNALSKLSSSQTVSPAIEAEIVDQLLSLSHLPHKKN